MLNNFKLSLKARGDIKAIFRYTYQEFGETKARSYQLSFEDCFALIVSQPEIGRSCDWIKSGYRRHEHESHVIYYRKRKNDVFIIRVLHHKQDTTKHL